MLTQWQVTGYVLHACIYTSIYHTHTLTHIPEGCAAVLKKRGLLFLPV